MYTLTNARLETIEQSLDAAAATLCRGGGIHCRTLEHELRDLLGTGYRELKDVMLQLFLSPKYTLLAAYYMQHIDAPVVVAEFKPTLAAFYGVEDFDSGECRAKRTSFWANLPRGQ